MAWTAWRAPGAQAQLEAAVFLHRVHPFVFTPRHQPDRHHEPVAADLRHPAGTRVDAQAQQLEGPALGQGLLELAAGGHDLLRRTGVAQHLEQQHDGVRQGHERGGPVLQIGLAFRARAMLPVVVGGQVEFAGATRNADAAADAHEPVVFRQALARLAVHGIEVGETLFELADHLVQGVLGNGRVAAVAVEVLLVLLDVLEHIGFHVRPRRHVHDLEDRLDREVVVEGVFPGHQLSQAPEQVFEPEISPNAFVERVFVQDHGVSGVNRRFIVPKSSPS